MKKDPLVQKDTFYAKIELIIFYNMVYQSTQKYNLDFKALF